MATNSPATVVSSIPSGSKPKVNQPQLQQQQLATVISSDILDDLGSRFIINVPENERQNLIRVCFQIELAHWFYLDFYCVAQKQKCGIKQFAYQLFQRIPFLLPHLSYVEKILEDWKQYKLSVPTYGAILLSEDLKHVLLVQSFWAKSSWGFPKGKINENEEPIHCAIREVYEETGYDIKNLLVPSEFIELIINYQYTRLYLIRGVPISTVFAPRTRNEIKCCEWFPIEPLPVTKNENFVKDNLSMNGNSFFMILPFVKRLKKWLEKIQKTKHKGPAAGGSSGSPVFSSTGKQNTKFFENKTGCAANHSQAGNRQRQRHKSMGDIEQQQSKSTGSQNFVTPEQFAKHPGTNSAYQDVAPATADTQAAGGTASNKKSHGKKHSASHNESGIPGGSTGGRTQIKRKLFDPLTEDKPKAVDSNDPFAMFNECQAWVGFKLDYSKFL
ncbi:m7GpppN-mRNA hydrolase [Ochlerotatus camptorhynchus]|uniref:m7GpppN-mRNA hydrolase n=1 Tax=Ochlerotatus camptorhynchus TaxID=644619 RepID=UPI0031E2B1F3